MGTCTRLSVVCFFSGRRPNAFENRSVVDDVNELTQMSTYQRGSLSSEALNY